MLAVGLLRIPFMRKPTRNMGKCALTHSTRGRQQDLIKKTVLSLGTGKMTTSRPTFFGGVSDLKEKMAGQRNDSAKGRKGGTLGKTQRA